MLHLGLDIKQHLVRGLEIVLFWVTRPERLCLKKKDGFVDITWQQNHLHGSTDGLEVSLCCNFTSVLVEFFIVLVLHSAQKPLG